MITFDKEKGLTSQLFETGTKPQAPVKVDGTSYRTKPDADKIRSGKLKEKVTFSATLNGKQVTGVGPINVVTTPEGVESRTVGIIKTADGEVIPANSPVDSWTKFVTPGEGRERGHEFGQYILPDGKISPVVKIDTVTSWDSNNRPVTTYSTVINGRSINILLADYKPFTQQNEPYRREPTPFIVSATGDLITQLSNVPGMEGVKAGDKIELYRALPIKDKGGVEQQELRFKGRKVKIPKELLDKATQTGDLSPVQRRELGLDIPPDEPYVTYQNTGQITRMLPDGREVPPGGTTSLTATDYRNLASEARDALRKIQPADAAGVRRMVTKAFKLNAGTSDEISYAPGDWRTDNNAAFAVLPREVQQSLSDDPDLKKETLKKEHFKSFWKQIVDQQVNAGSMLKASKKATPSEDDLSALLGQFPTGRRGVGALRQAILDMIQLAPTAGEVSAGEAETEALSYGDSIQEELNNAKKRYDTLLGKGIISGNQRWENLGFEAQRAFADIARGRINVAKINQQWEKAQEKLAKLKNNFEILDANEVASFNSAARLLILLRDLRDSNDLSKTGRFWVGFFSKLGVEVFADFKPLTTAPSQRLLAMITDMQSSLKTLSGTEGLDGRVSNFRMQLQQDLLPDFNKPEALNKRNLDIIISKLENNIRGVFTPEIALKYVIPQNFVQTAREAGIPKANVDPRRYPFVNPNVEGPPGITKRGVLSSIGKAPYSLANFQNLKIGRTLPADSRGRTLVKVSETEVQYALPNGMPDKDSPKFLAADMFQNAPVE